MCSVSTGPALSSLSALLWNYSIRPFACQVFQVQKKDTGQVYAMKVMRKERIIAKDHGEYVRAERNVLTAVFHPYIVTLRCSFQVMLISISSFCSFAHSCIVNARDVKLNAFLSPKSA